MFAFDLGYCTWTVARANPRAAIERVGAIDGLRAVQVGVFSKSALTEADPAAVRSAAERAGVSIVGFFFGFEGEDYQSIASIAATGGLAPDQFVNERLALLDSAAAMTRALGAPSLSIHAGTISEDNASESHRKLVDRARSAAEIAARHGLKLLLETGRESAAALSRFMVDVGAPNLAVSFDPANFVIYGTDDPVKAVTALRDRIELAHLKDATRSPRPGVTYGAKAPFGTGDVMIPRVLSKLRAVGYSGPLLLEIDPGEELGGLCDAISYLRSMLA